VRENLSLDLVLALSTYHKMARSPRLPRSPLLSGVRDRREKKLQLNFSIDMEQLAEDNTPKLEGGFAVGQVIMSLHPRVMAMEV